MPRPKARILALLAGLTLAVLLSLLLLLVPAARTFVLEPIVKAVEAAGSALHYVPQDVQWLVALLILFISVMGYVGSRIPKSRREYAIRPRDNIPTEGPTMLVARMFDESARYRHRHVQLVLELRDLAARVLAQHRGIPLLRAKEILDSEAWTDDPVVREYLSTERHRVMRGRRRPHVEVARLLAEIERIHQEV